ncbi:Sua5/YciO/YrdC/YwlC family protein [Lebetimonas sp. JH292]|uniref:Sua5/YciO/YrdC/YwlC family protein n=1 Tax=Lebetimonas sp. JH292 TaxID=990068 RepID=UPI0004645EB4|nr:Sua5/YciO/YrdC/YwlC family protein [Lebetimonas sp. JH292]
MNPNKIYLVQTDTTVGFLSRDKKRLNKIKNRPINQPVLIEADSLKTLKQFARVPNKFKNRVRRSKKTTFIYPNKKSFRIVKDERHLEFLKKFSWMYSTSANKSGRKFDEMWARNTADVTVENKRGLFEGKPSKIYKLSRNKIKKIR